MSNDNWMVEHLKRKGYNPDQPRNPKGMATGGQWTSGQLSDLPKMDDRIEEVSDERNEQGGIWVYLKPGWCNGDLGSHIIHEDTKREIKFALKRIIKCNCPECIR